MEFDNYWKVHFAAFNDDVDNPDIDVGINGDIIVKALNIFEALEFAQTKIKTFGYERTVIYSGAKMDNYKKAADA